MSTVADDLKEKIIFCFEAFFRYHSSPACLTDNVIHRGVDTVVVKGETNLLTLASQFSIHEHITFDDIMHDMLGGMAYGDEEGDDIHWNRDHDFSILTQTYGEHELDDEVISAKRQVVRESCPIQDREQVFFDQLRSQ